MCQQVSIYEMNEKITITAAPRGLDGLVQQCYNTYYYYYYYYFESNDKSSSYIIYTKKRVERHD